MFVRLAEAKHGEIDAQLETLRMQHERGRGLVNTVAESIEGYEKGSPFRKTELIVAASGYAAMLHHHIHLEDTVFYPLVREVLSEKEMKELTVEFYIDGAKTGVDVVNKARAAIGRMSAALIPE